MVFKNAFYVETDLAKTNLSGESRLILRQLRHG